MKCIRLISDSGAELEGDWETWYGLLRVADSYGAHLVHPIPKRYSPEQAAQLAEAFECAQVADAWREGSIAERDPRFTEFIETLIGFFRHGAFEVRAFTVSGDSCRGDDPDLT